VPAYSISLAKPFNIRWIGRSALSFEPTNRTFLPVVASADL